MNCGTPKERSNKIQTTMGLWRQFLNGRRLKHVAPFVCLLILMLLSVRYAGLLVTCLNSDTGNAKVVVHVAMSVCGAEAQNDFLNTLKSIIFHGQSTEHEIIHMHVFTYDVEDVENLLHSLNHIIPPTLALFVHPLESSAEFNIFRRCSGVRLYMSELFLDQSLMPETLIYLDADTLVTAPLINLHRLIASNRTEHTLFALAEEGNTVYLSRSYSEDNTTKVPYPEGTSGLNAGVMVMMLHRMRQRNFTHMVKTTTDFALSHKIPIPYGDQCILNLMAARNPSIWMRLPCYWNLRTSTMKVCIDEYEEMDGGIIHGNNFQFKNNPQFRMVRHHLIP